jgi:hypothetical protein
VHREGASSGTDLHTGVKRFQVVNHAKFASKWADVLVGQPQRPSRFDRGAWYALVHAEAGGA